MSFENQIQQWVSLDNQLKQLNEKTKDLREKRNVLEEKITDYASSNNLSNAVIEISDGKLKFAKTKVQEPLTFKYLEKTLSEVIKNESQVKIIMEHIKQKRASKFIPEIKRFSNN
jgi:dihydroorotase